MFNHGDIVITSVVKYATPQRDYLLDDNKNSNNQVIVHYNNNAIERDGQRFKLDRRQVELLAFFLANPNQVIERTTLISQVWQSVYTSDDTINKTVSNLRKALSTQRNLFITTIPKVGYRFSVPANVLFKVGLTEQQQPTHTTQHTEQQNEAKLNTTEPHAQISDKTSKITDNTTSKNSLNSAVIIAVACVLVAIIFSGYWSISTTLPDSTKAQPNPNKVVKTPAPIVLSINAIELADSQVLSKGFIDVLREQILYDLAMVKSINVFDTVDKNQTKSANQKTDVVLKAKMLDFDGTAKLTLQLFDATNGTRVFSTIIDATINNEQALLTHLSKQAVAAIKSGLLHPKLFKRFAPALKQLNHVELEQLILASNHVKRSMPKALEKALTMLETINENKPNTPEVLGLLAAAHLQAKTSFGDSYISSSDKIDAFAQQALALDPSNLHALQALGTHYANNPHLRHKASHVINAMLRYHPDETIAWRYQLYWMVQTARTCDDIRSFIEHIPTGLFKANRLEVIGQILDTCGSPKQTKLIEQMWQQRQLDSNGNPHKSLPKSISLFNRVNDFSVEIQQSGMVHYTGPHMNIALYQIKLAMGDMAGAKIIFDELKRTTSNYWLSSANLMAQVYQQPTIDDIPTVATQHYHLLDTNTNLYVVANLIQNTQNPQKQANAKQSLHDYLKYMPEFEVGINTRNEAIALMMAQRGAGKIVDSQQTANRLSKQLLRYLNDSPASYYFWNMGWLQLVSDFYCGPSCQPLPLSKLFEPTHRWWIDDIGILRIALKPWADEPLVQEYFELIAKDQLRVKTRLGI